MEFSLKNKASRSHLCFISLNLKPVVKDVAFSSFVNSKNFKKNWTQNSKLVQTIEAPASVKKNNGKTEKNTA